MHECIQQLTPGSVTLIYNSGSYVPMNLLCSWEWSGAPGELLLSIISPAGALTGACGWRSGKRQSEGARKSELLGQTSKF